MENKEPNGLLSWEEERENWKKAMELQKEGFLSRVQALEEENERIKNELLYLRHWRTDAEKELTEFGKVKSRVFDLEEELAAYRVTSIGRDNSFIELQEENKRLQERLSAAEEVIKSQKDFYNSMHGRGIVADLSKELVMNEAIEKYNSLKK